MELQQSLQTEYAQEKKNRREMESEGPRLSSKVWTHCAASLEEESTRNVAMWRDRQIFDSGLTMCAGVLHSGERAHTRLSQEAAMRSSFGNCEQADDDDDDDSEP